jgi:membrane associated rhomboid family serine protease
MATQQRRRLCSCNAFVIVMSAPLSTGIALCSLALLLLDNVHNGLLTENMAIYPFRYFRGWWDLYRLLTWPLLHRNFAHAWANLATLLLLGPPLEERIGSLNLGGVLAVTSVVTGLLHASLFSNGLIGASGMLHNQINPFLCTRFHDSHIHHP